MSTATTTGLTAHPGAEQRHATRERLAYLADTLAVAAQQCLGVIDAGTGAAVKAELRREAADITIAAAAAFTASGAP